MISKNRTLIVALLTVLSMAVCFVLRARDMPDAIPDAMLSDAPPAASTAAQALPVNITPDEQITTAEKKAFAPSSLTIMQAKQEFSETQETQDEQEIQADQNLETPDEASRVYIGTFQVYGYDPFCYHCNGKTDGITASGLKATFGQTVAMKGYPFGTKLYIEGLGEYIVEDRGVGSGIIDVACKNHAACHTVTGKYDVYIVA